MNVARNCMDAMADQIRVAFAGVTDVDIQIEPRMVLNPTPPTIDIYPGEPSRDDSSLAFGDVMGALALNVRARVSPADNVAEQDLLLAFMDDEDDLSIPMAIFDDPTLGGYAMSLGVDPPSGFVLFPTTDGAGAYIGCLWRFMVIPARS